MILQAPGIQGGYRQRIMREMSGFLFLFFCATNISCNSSIGANLPDSSSPEQWPNASKIKIVWSSYRTSLGDVALRFLFKAVCIFASEGLWWRISPWLTSRTPSFWHAQGILGYPLFSSKTYIQERWNSFSLSSDLSFLRNLGKGCLPCQEGKLRIRSIALSLQSWTWILCCLWCLILRLCKTCRMMYGWGIQSSWWAGLSDWSRSECACLVDLDLWT